MSDQHLKTLLSYIVDSSIPGMEIASFINNHADWWRSLPEASLIKKFISQDPEYSYYYALLVIKGRWPEGETAIANNYHWAYYYALLVIKGRWPEGETAIATDPEWAYYYAVHVVKGRFPEGEKAINGSVYAARYAKFVKKSKK